MAVYKRYKKKIVRVGHPDYDKGTFYIQFRLNGVDYKKAHPECRTKKLADAKEVSLRQDILSGRFEQESKIVVTTFREFVEVVYLPWASLNKRSAEDDEQRCKVLSEYFGDYRLEEIQPMMIERFKREMLSRKNQTGGTLKPSTVNRYRALLSKVLSLACDNGLLVINPASRVRKFQEPDSRERYLTDDEHQRLLKVLTHENGLAFLKPAVILAANTGLRKQDLLNLTPANVNFVANQLELKVGKTSKRLLIPLNEEAQEVLRYLCWGLAENEPIFSRQRNNITYRTITTGWIKARELTGLEDVQWRDLRRTFATWLRSNNVHEWDIAALLGHSSVNTTKIYARTVPDKLRQAVSSLDKAEKSNVVELAKNRR